MEHIKKNRKQMRGFIIFVVLLALINFIFELNLPHYVWIILFFLISMLALVHTMDIKLRALDKRIKDLEDNDNKD